MEKLDQLDILRMAREMRARELQRCEGIIAERMELYFRLLGASLLHGLDALGGLLRPLFSWNPQPYR